MFNGLTTQQVNEKLKVEGFNELPSTKPKNILTIAIEVIKEPMFLLLLSCGVLYLFLGDYREGMVLLSTSIVIIGITFYQYRKTERALEALKNLSSPRVMVIRDGREVRIAGREVVPEDIMVLHEGDRIAADATLLESVNLKVDESLLTGESIPVEKTTAKGESGVSGGTLVVQGSGLAQVIATGINTQIGKIGTSLQNIENNETQLQVEMKSLIKKLFIGGTLISVGVVIAFYFSRGNFIQSLLNGLATSMAILPEEFPVVLTIFLALGAWRLSQKNVLTRKPSSIETLGSTTVLCSDKTGTLTENKMTVAIAYNGHKIFSRSEFKNCKDELSQLLLVGHCASQTNSMDPMDSAIQRLHHEILNEPLKNHKVIREYPLTRKYLAMTRILQYEEETTQYAYMKGAPETILELCQLTKREKAEHLHAVQEMASSGYRVIGIAKAVHSGELPMNQTDFEFSFMGLLGLEDPIRPEVPEAIKACQQAGIKVIMITGDFPSTAQSIARQIGLPNDLLITGKQLESMSDDDLKEQIKRVSIFARTVPEQKLRIVRVLQSNGEIVAMTGDGVNDAPALKAANIGVSMGSRGTDVAREASSLVLLDDNFASIVAAIRSGRRIFDNLQKAMSYIMAIHIPIIGLTLLPALIPTLPILLLPLHIVFMEMIIDPVCSVAFESEPDEKGIMNRMPRNPKEPFFGSKRIWFSVFAGSLLLSEVLLVYFLSLREGHTVGEVRAIAFSALIVGNIFLILTDLSKTRSFISIIIRKNAAAIFILAAALIILFLIVSLPPLQLIFNFEFPGYQHFVPALLASTVLLIILESIKYYRVKPEG